MYESDAYLDGTLTAEAKAQFDAELARNSTLRDELEEARGFRERLQTIRIRNRVRQALREAPPDPAPGFPWRWRFLALAAVVLAGGFWLWQNTRPHPVGPAEPVSNLPAPPAEPHTATEPDSLSGSPQPETRNPSKKTTTTRNPKPETRPGTEVQPANPQPANPKPETSIPIAQTPPPRTAPGDNPDRPQHTRGESGPLPADLQRVLDAIGPLRFEASGRAFNAPYTAIATQLAQQHWAAANTAARPVERSAGMTDTLALLRGYALLGLDAPADAAGYLRRLDRPGQPWRDETLWLLGRCALLQHDAAQAAGYWKRVTPGGAYGRRAGDAVRVVGRR